MSLRPGRTSDSHPVDVWGSLYTLTPCLDTREEGGPGPPCPDHRGRGYTRKKGVLRVGARPDPTFPFWESRTPESHLDIWTGLYKISVFLVWNLGWSGGPGDGTIVISLRLCTGVLHVTPVYRTRNEGLGTV